MQEVLGNVPSRAGGWKCVLCEVSKSTSETPCPAYVSVWAFGLRYVSHPLGICRDSMCKSVFARQPDFLSHGLFKERCLYSNMKVAASNRSQCVTRKHSSKGVFE